MQYNYPVIAPYTNFEDDSHSNIFIYGQEYPVKSLLDYISNFDNAGHAAHLHASYIEYRRKSIYYESQLSVLFAGIDSIYTKLGKDESEDEKNKALMYDTFLKSITSIDTFDIDKKVLKFLKVKGTKKAFIGLASFADHINAMYDFIGSKRLNADLLKRINTLRNNIAHGNDYVFDDFVTVWEDPNDHKLYPAIEPQHIESLADTLWESIKRLTSAK
jgi:hypothetical protein